MPSLLRKPVGLLESDRVVGANSSIGAVPVQLSHPNEPREYADPEEVIAAMRSRLAHPVPAPAKILKYYIVIFGLLHGLACAMIYYATMSARPGWTAWFWVLASVPPIFVWAAYRDCHAAWQGRTSGDWESVMPVAVVGGLAFLAYLLLP